MAVLADMGVLGDGAEILQPMLKNRFRVDFFGIGTDSQVLTVQVVTVDKPKMSFEEVVLDRYNSRGYLAGKHTFETISIVLESDIGGGVARVIREQLEQQQKIIGMNPAPRMPAARAGNDYKFGIAIRQLDGDEYAYESWYLDGCWIQNADNGDLDYATSEQVKITLTIRFDHARQDIANDARLNNATGAGAVPF